MGKIETMVNVLAEVAVPAAAWGVEKKRQADKLEAQKKYFWHELSVLRENLPQSECEQGQLFWLALNHFTGLPKTYHDNEVNHDFGTVKALAAGITKSAVLNQPMVEIHATACPSYLDEDDWNTVGKETGIYVYQSINWQKVHQLVAFSKVFSFNFIKGVYLHTPLLQDLTEGCDFPGCFGIFQNGQEGKNSLYVHQKKMEEIAGFLPGVTLCPDSSYMNQFINGEMAAQLMELPAVAEAWKKFRQSEYINSAYTKWGAKAIDVFKAFYLGSILAYGNHQSVWNSSNNQPIKLYLNLEEGQSPFTFAGQSVGMDFRHLLAEKGYHLPLLIGNRSIVTPWMEK